MRSLRRHIIRTLVAVPALVAAMLTGSASSATANPALQCIDDSTGGNLGCANYHYVKIMDTSRDFAKPYVHYQFNSGAYGSLNDPAGANNGYKERTLDRTVYRFRTCEALVGGDHCSRWVNVN